MEDILRIGPLALPFAPLQLFAAWWVGDALAQRQAARRQLVWGWQGWALLVCCLLAARAAFVIEFAPHYATPAWAAFDIRDGGWTATPAWAAFDIRDGGWTATAGVVAVLLYGSFLWLKRSPLAQPAITGIASALLLWGGAQGLRYAMAPTQAPLPTFSAVALDAQTLQLDQLAQQRGQPLVINLWATWCPPCRREMPALLQAQQDYPGVRFLWVNQGESPETVLQYAAQHHLPPAQVLLDERQELGRLLRSSALPTTVFVDSQGRQSALRVGELSAATLAQYLQPLLAPAANDRSAGPSSTASATSSSRSSSASLPSPPPVTAP